MLEAFLKLLRTPTLQEFVKLHEQEDEKTLVLKQPDIHGVPSSIVAQQVSGRRKAKTKLPSFYNNNNIIYPPGINVEQCSSEATATFKAALYNGKKFVDLTGGFGVDTFFLSKKFREGYYIEPNLSLLEIVRLNHAALGNDTIIYENTSAENFLSSTKEHFDLMFIDPSRRSETNQKVFKLSDCIPNITQLHDTLFDHTSALLIKTSPLLDLQQALKELKFVERIIVVSVDNECKEVLFACRKGFDKEPLIEAVNLLKDNKVDSFSFYSSEEKQLEIEISDPLLYLYEPNASILKAGAFKSIGAKNNLAKIHSSTHLYTSNELIENFPGRIFKIQSLVKPEATILKQYFPEGKANVSTRNYPLTPAELKKKTGLKDGGEKFLLGFSGTQKKFLAVAERVR